MLTVFMFCSKKEHIINILKGFENMSHIQKGDAVRLKSGGPTMTVQNLDNYSSHGIKQGALCVWFQDNEAKEKVFDVVVLTQYEPHVSRSFQTAVRRSWSLPDFFCRPLNQK
jgi:uncharacterized protein YodC (DUF2158 family)